MVNVDPPEAERALAARRMADCLLQPVILRRLEDAVLGADPFGQLFVGGEGVGAEDGPRLDDVAEAVDDLIL